MSCKKMMVSTANEGKLRMCTHSVKLFKEKRKRKRGLEKFIDDERATRLVWRIGSDVALLVSYVTSKRTLYYYNSHRPLVINYLARLSTCPGYLRELYLSILWLTLRIFWPSKNSRSMSTSRPRIDSLRSSSTIDHSAWGARAPSPSVSLFFGDDAFGTDCVHHSVLDHNNGLKSQSAREPCVNYEEGLEAVHYML